MALSTEAELEAQESRAAHVTAAYRLTFDERANAYRVDEQCDVEEEQVDESHAAKVIRLAALQAITHYE